MKRGDIITGTRRRLLTAAPSAAVLVLAVREKGRAKSPLAKYGKKQRARAKADALGRMSTELAGFTDPITRLQNLGETFLQVGGAEQWGQELLSISAAFEDSRERLLDDLAIARGEAVSS